MALFLLGRLAPGFLTEYSNQDHLKVVLAPDSHYELAVNIST